MFYIAVMLFHGHNGGFISLLNTHGFVMLKAGPDRRNLKSWSPAAEKLIQEVAILLFKTQNVRDNHSGIIAESLARFADAAPSVTDEDWLKWIEAYNEQFKGTESKGAYIDSEGRQYLLTIGRAMEAKREKWPNFVLRRRETAYSATPLIIFALLWVKSQHSPK